MKVNILVVRTVIVPDALLGQLEAQVRNKRPFIEDGHHVDIALIVEAAIEQGVAVDEAIEKGVFVVGKEQLIEIDSEDVRSDLKGKLLNEEETETVWNSLLKENA